MDVVRSLEISVRRLIETVKKLKAERDGAYEDAANIRRELQDARQTIEGLKLTIERYDKPDDRLRELERKKREIVGRLKTLQEKISTYIDTEKNTNDQD